MADWSDWASSLRGLLGIPDPNQQPQGLLSDPYLNTGAKTATTLGLLADRAAPKVAGIPGSIWQGVEDAATAGKYGMGNPDRLTTDQIIPSIANSAMALAAGGMPMAETGAAGIFGGKLTSDPAGFAKLGEGKDMLTAGVNPRDTYLQTGAWKGPEGMMRYEIPDYNATLTPYAEAAVRIGRNFDGPLKNFIDHPELFQAYPHLAETPVSFNPSGIHGGAYTPPTGNFSPPNHSIMIKGNDPSQVQSILLHEIQHAVQSNEGFTPGWSKGGAQAEALQLADRARQAGMPQQAINEKLWNNFDPYDAYKRAAGEVEARAVQRRAGLNPENAAVFSPDFDMTAEYPRSKWIVRQPNGILGQR
jgi:hypothetical protein